MISPVIVTEHLTKDHMSHFLRKRFRALDGLTLSVDRSETYGLIGLNGAGKTTTLKLLLGLLKPTSGSVSVLGSPGGAQQTLRKIGFLPESPHFYSYLTGAEFLDFSGKVFGLTKVECKERAADLLKMVSLTEAAKTAIGKYSKGMMQRLGIAQSLINDPEIIFWDEPTSGLDPIGRRDVRMILLKLKEQGKTIFLNSHLLPDVNEVCDRVGVLHRGRLVGTDKISSITGGGSYQDLEAYFLECISSSEVKV